VPPPPPPPPPPLLPPPPPVLPPPAPAKPPPQEVKTRLRLAATKNNANPAKSLPRFKGEACSAVPMSANSPRPSSGYLVPVLLVVLSGVQHLKNSRAHQSCCCGNRDHVRQIQGSRIIGRLVVVSEVVSGGRNKEDAILLLGRNRIT